MTPANTTPSHSIKKDDVRFSFFKLSPHSLTPLWLMLGLAFLFSGCGEEGDETEDSKLGSNTSAVTGTRIDRSLVVTDPEILARFSFDRVVREIRTTAVRNGERLSPTEDDLAVFQRWMRSFNTGPDGCNRPGIDPNRFGLVCPRTPEGKLATSDPFTRRDVTFFPVGLFNRFDLLPASGSNCGEYRIVYAMRSTNPLIGGRAFIIFEAALPNPTPSRGIESCLPVAQFWQGLTNDLSITSRATKLENFYFNGTAVVGFSPVVSAKNFGLITSNGSTTIPERAGQIRTNFFIDFREWQLREFKLQTSCPTSSSCQLLFNHVTVKNNPAEELFAGNAPVATQQAFQQAFVAQVSALSSADPANMAMAIPDNFNEFESISTPSSAPSVVYRLRATQGLRQAVQIELSRRSVRLTPENIFDRATSQTCAGCHQLSNTVDLGNGLRFPPSNGFVHIDEGQRLSPALTQVFLPARLRALERFITAREVPPRPAGSTSIPPN